PAGVFAPASLGLPETRVFRLGLLLSIAIRVSAALALDPARAPTQYVHDVWKTADGLPQDSVFAIAQAHDGYLWLATEQGLVRFDGVRFTVFDTSNVPELKHDRMEALAVDRDGTLWIGTARGLFGYREGAFTLAGPSDGVSSDVVRSLRASA